jgi:hypothetical protein
VVLENGRGASLPRDRFHPSRGTGGEGEMAGSTLRERYEAEVRGLAHLRDEWLSAGVEVEHVARRLHRKRRAIGVRYKLQTPLFGKRGQLAVYRRNLRKYGNPLGPSVEWLRSRGRTWEEICGSACRTGGRDLS